MALSDFRGKIVALSFLDPDCTDICPLTALQFQLTAEALGEDAVNVVFLAVNVNPQKNTTADVAAASERWRIQKLQGWHYLTGSRDELELIYRAYGVEAEGPPKLDKPNELSHTPGVFVIDQSGSKRWYVSAAFDPSLTLSDLLVKHIKRLLQ